MLAGWLCIVRPNKHRLSSSKWMAWRNNTTHHSETMREIHACEPDEAQSTIVCVYEHRMYRKINDQHREFRIHCAK